MIMSKNDTLRVLSAWMALTLAVLSVLSGCSPLYEARMFMQSPAGEKLVDHASAEVETGLNPAIEVYAIQGFGMRLLDVKSGARFGGAVTDDERPAANRPVALPVD